VTDRPLTPPATIGMLGGGQLGRYAVMAAATMGYRTIVLDPDPNAPAGTVANEHIVAAYDDPAAIRRLGRGCDVVTTEFENPSAAVLDALALAVPVAPSSSAVRIAQDRIAEKQFLTRAGFPVGAYAVLDGSSTQPTTGTELDPGLTTIADAAIVKTARLGYDGKGQRIASDLSQVAAAWTELGGVPCVVEALLELETELSVIVARTADGRSTVWPVAENRHVDGILDLTVVPAAIAPRVADRAVDLGVAVAHALDFVGVMAVELFVVAGDLLVNELAPRPHNSGHWTLDACVTSQFEQQIRAVCGTGLGDTSMTSPSVAMVNLLGDLWHHGEPEWSVALEAPDAKLHLYGKQQARPGRKMGHLTVRAARSTTAATRASALRQALVADADVDRQADEGETRRPA
jgi:5-(carboxyamino)imidazole ribonucleotide synthase